MPSLLMLNIYVLNFHSLIFLLSGETYVSFLKAKGRNLELTFNECIHSLRCKVTRELSSCRGSWLPVRVEYN